MGASGDDDAVAVVVGVAAGVAGPNCSAGNWMTRVCSPFSSVALNAP